MLKYDDTSLASAIVSTGRQRERTGWRRKILCTFHQTAQSVAHTSFRVPLFGAGATTGLAVSERMADGGVNSSGGSRCAQCVKLG